MLNQEQWLNNFNTEIQLARSFREQGNEGRARVCARRAAGIAVRAYLSNKFESDPGSNAYELLKTFITKEQIPEEVRQIANHFLLKVDTEFNLPDDIDLIADAQKLARMLNG
jgi:HEPN domain-containing protein